MTFETCNFLFTILQLNRLAYVRRIVAVWSQIGRVHGKYRIQWANPFKSKITIQCNTWIYRITWDLFATGWAWFVRNYFNSMSTRRHNCQACMYGTWSSVRDMAWAERNPYSIRKCFDFFEVCNVFLFNVGDLQNCFNFITVIKLVLHCKWWPMFATIEYVYIIIII